MTTRHTKQSIVAVTVSVIATLAVYGVAMRSRPGPAARLQLLTAKQIADRSAPICHLLAAQDKDLQQVTESLFRVDRGGVKHKIWVVDCVDNRGNHVVHTVWDAETGGLVVATHRPQRGADDLATRVTADRAAKVAWRWLEATGVGRMAPRWKMERTPRLDGLSWCVILSSPQYDATVIFDKNTQDLVYLTVKELPPPVHTS